MKVKDLIAILQTMPQELPVTSYSAGEETCEVTKRGIKVYEKGESEFFNRNGKRSKQAHVDIMAVW